MQSRARLTGEDGARVDEVGAIDRAEHRGWSRLVKPAMEGIRRMRIDELRERRFGDAAQAQLRNRFQGKPATRGEPLIRRNGDCCKDGGTRVFGDTRIGGDPPAMIQLRLTPTFRIGNPGKRLHCQVASRSPSVHGLRESVPIERIAVEFLDGDERRNAGTSRGKSGGGHALHRNVTRVKHAGRDHHFFEAGGDQPLDPLARPLGIHAPIGVGDHASIQTPLCRMLNQRIKIMVEEEALPPRERDPFDRGKTGGLLDERMHSLNGDRAGRLRSTRKTTVIALRRTTAHRDQREDAWNDHSYGVFGGGGSPMMIVIGPATLPPCWTTICGIA